MEPKGKIYIFSMTFQKSAVISKLFRYNGFYSLNPLNVKVIGPKISKFSKNIQTFLKFSNFYKIPNFLYDF